MGENKRKLRAFSFCGMFNVGIEGPNSLLERIAGNIHTEVDPVNAKLHGRIIINEPEVYETITRDKKFPYLTIKNGPAGKSITYYRYDTFVREIRQKNGGLYEVDINTEDDEAAGLICFRNFCNNHPSLTEYPLVHASLVNLEGEGVLISGDSKAGKTTLMVYLMEQFGARFVSEDNVYLRNDMTGVYFPKVPLIRFPTVRDSCLSPLFWDLATTDATQPWDIESLESVVANKNFGIDGALAISRRKVAQMCGVSTDESIRINRVILPSFSEEGLKLEEIEQEDGFRILEKFGREKKKSLDHRDIAVDYVSLEGFERRGIRFYKLGYSGLRQLIKEDFAL